MTKPELKDFLTKKRTEAPFYAAPYMLDDTVHDAASQLASNANNEGIDGQLNFLMDTCGWSSEDILNKIGE